MSLLRVEEVSVSFGGVSALTDVDLTLESGSVTGLIGPNGAGKTTLFKVVSGLQAPDSGRVVFDGRDITSLKPYQRARLGIGRTFQRLEIFGSLTVRDNIRVSAEILKDWKRDAPPPLAVADEIIDRLGLAHVARVRADELPTGMAHLVELGRALAGRPRLLLLDEPSSGMGPEEAHALGERLLELRKELSLTMLMIEHHVPLVVGVCDYVYVLNFGQILTQGKPRAVQQHPEVIRAYLGGEAEVVEDKLAHEPTPEQEESAADAPA